MTAMAVTARRSRVAASDSRSGRDMLRAMLGKKIGMTQVFDEDGALVPVTVLQIGPCAVVQIKNDADGACTAVQIGFEERKRKNTPRPQLGHFNKAGVSPKRLLRDVAPEEGAQLEPGQSLGVEVFADTQTVDVISTSKGRGFAGVIKRHGFHGGPASHGSKVHRHGGSIGAGSSPGHVIKGMKMPGHMGAARVTVRNLRVVKLDEQRNLMLVKGAVPGARNGHVLVRKAAAAHTGAQP